MWLYGDMPAVLPGFPFSQRILASSLATEGFSATESMLCATMLETRSTHLTRFEWISTNYACFFFTSMKPIYFLCWTRAHFTILDHALAFRRKRAQVLVTFPRSNFGIFDREPIHKNPWDHDDYSCRNRSQQRYVNKYCNIMILHELSCSYTAHVRNLSVLYLFLYPVLYSALILIPHLLRRHWPRDSSRSRQNAQHTHHPGV